MAPSLDQIEEIQWLTRSEEPIFRADFNFAPATIYAKTLSASSGEWISFDVSQAVLDWYRKTKTNYGVALSSAPGSPLSRLHSREAVGSSDDEKICEWAEPDNIRQIDRPNVQAANLVTITIGGNDAGFADIVEKCAVPDPDPLSLGCAFDNAPGAIIQRLGGWVDEQLEHLFDRLRTVFSAINNATGNKPLLVLGYPNISDKFPGLYCDIHDSPQIPWLLSYPSRRYLVEVGKEINRRVKCAAAYENVIFVDVDAEFENKLCSQLGAEESTINGV